MNGVVQDMPIDQASRGGDFHTAKQIYQWQQRRTIGKSVEKKAPPYHFVSQREKPLQFVA